MLILTRPHPPSLSFCLGYINRPWDTASCCHVYWHISRCSSQSCARVADLPSSSPSWPPSGSRHWADRPVWTLVGWGWHSAVGGPWWICSQSSACTGAASAAPQGHRTHCTLTMNWPPSYHTDSAGDREWDQLTLQQAGMENEWWKIISCYCLYVLDLSKTFPLIFFNNLYILDFMNCCPVWV